MIFELDTLYLAGKVAGSIVGLWWLTRATTAAVEAYYLQSYRENNEVMGTAALDYAEVSGVGDPDEALEESQENKPRGPDQRSRLVKALVIIARAEFGAPFGPAFSKPVIVESTRIKVGDFLRKACRDRHVRKVDTARLVDLAVDLYFVPTRRDLSRARAMSSAAVADRAAFMAYAAAHKGPGWFARLFMRLQGADVALPGFFTPHCDYLPDGGQRRGVPPAGGALLGQRV